MKVRDMTKKRSEYKGRETDASEKVCPCRSCFNAHNCGSYGNVQMECATRYNCGCPRPKPKAEHSFNRVKRCKRCGVFKKERSG